MLYTLSRPCKDCPFRTDCLKGWLGEARAEEIITSMLDKQQTFTCHSTNEFGEDDDGNSITIETSESQHCAGAMILLEKLGRPNQMMRIAERLGLYDMNKLDMSSPVFDDEGEFIDHHGD